MAVGGDKPDRVSGSVDLFSKAVMAVREHLLRRGTGDFDALLDHLETEHPSMALRLNLVEALRASREGGREALLGALEDFGREVAEARVAVAAEFAALVHAKGWTSLATYSRSGQVREALAAARMAGAQKALLSEARPEGEGYLAAAELRGEGYEVTLVADAALPAHLAESQALVVGADASFREGFANKVGSAALLREARRCGLDTVVLTLPQKALSGTGASRWRNLAMDPPKEARKPRRGIAWAGDLFEVVPWDLAVRVLGRG